MIYRSLQARVPNPVSTATAVFIDGSDSEDEGEDAPLRAQFRQPARALCTEPAGDPLIPCAETFEDYIRIKAMGLAPGAAMAYTLKGRLF